MFPAKSSCVCNLTAPLVAFYFAHEYRPRHISTVVLSIAYSGLRNLNLCPGARAVARSRTSSNSDSNISGGRRFIASDRVDLAPASSRDGTGACRSQAAPARSPGANPSP